MKVSIAKHHGMIIWDGVYNYPLSNYPNITPWELKKLLAFVEYEKCHDRTTEFMCEDKTILSAINHAIAFPETVQDASLPEKLTECTHCKQRGCLTKFVCHASTIENAKSILASGKLLSAVKVRGKTGAEIAANQLSAAYDPQDPADYFEHIMLAWGNCPAVDNLVMQREMLRKFDRLPTSKDLENAFEPGVRYYFKYKDVVSHPWHVFDGYHPAKIKDELVLRDYLFACIIPAHYKGELEQHIHPGLAGKVYFLEQDGLGLLGWAEKAYDFVCATPQPGTSSAQT